MAKRLSFQQILILRKLAYSPCSATEFKKYYSNCNLYRSLQNLYKKGLITKKNKKWHITTKGKIVLKVF